MAYILGTNLNGMSKVRIALSLIYGMGAFKAHLVCDQLGLSESVTINQLTRNQLDQITQLISQHHLVDSELKRLVYNDITRLLQIGSYRGLRHSGGLPLRGQRTHSNANTSRKRNRLFTAAAQAAVLARERL